MTPWRLTEYVSEERAFPFSAWLAGQDQPVQAAFYDVQKQLTTFEFWEDLPRRRIKTLTKDHVGLTQIMFDLESWHRPSQRMRRRRIRPLGVWDGSQFVLLGGAEEDGQNYIPTDAFREALRFRRAFIDGKGSTRDI